MSEAATIEELYQLEGQLLPPMVTWLTDHGMTAFRRRGTSELSGSRVEVDFRALGITGHYFIDTTGQAWHDAWNGQFVFRIVSVRGDGTAHNVTLGKIRYLTQYAAAEFTEARFPYHVITHIQEGQSPEIIEPEEDYDVTELTFEVVVGVRSNAWPES